MYICGECYSLARTHTLSFATDAAEYFQFFPQTKHRWSVRSCGSGIFKRKRHVGGCAHKLLFELNNKRLLVIQSANQDVRYIRLELLLSTVILFIV